MTTTTMTPTASRAQAARALPASAARVLLPAAGAALVVAQAVLPTTPSTAAGQAGAVAAHRGAEVVSAAAFVLAAALLVCGLVSAAGHRFDRGRALTRIGTVVTAVGTLWLVGGRAAYNLFEVAVVGSQDHATATAVTSAVSGSAAFGVLLVTLPAFLLGPVLLGLGLWRAGLTPWWPAGLWLVGGVVVAATESSLRLGPTVGMLLLTAALVTWGRALSRN
jgi:hypothetical protein